ncbi:hypothetical protein NQ315_016369 [Exocentrus adspersus]|uniref:Golgi-associated PDZ and coiled-coil motif-containing protein n=1 Tax=Exocentrus adspersus TaxID=1586481 RepID=A0AAV8VQ39_9CUCU|nr:hypothetical protein NQ315_016369 [Exocentrus adspersus]
MASIGFRWLDILEKEFDKAFVDLDLAIGELESEEPDVVFNVRQKLCTLSSCFAQLTHKAQTIFQNSAKIEVSIPSFYLPSLEGYRVVCICAHMCATER